MVKKLQRKFIILTTTISIIVMICIALAINIINYKSIMTYADDVLQIIAREELKPYSPDFAHMRLPKEFEFITRFFAIYTDSSDNIVSIDVKKIDSITPDEAVLYYDKVKDEGEITGLIENFRYTKVESSTGYTYVFLDIEKDIIGLENYTIYSISIAACAVILIFLLSCILSKKAVSPIAASYNKQRRFITDVSHEFKTPLSIIKADCDVIEIDKGNDQWIESIKAQVKRLDTLVVDLISLTRLDEEKKVILRTDFSLSDALNDVIKDFHPAITNRQCQLTVNVTDNVSYNGDEVYIRKLLYIIMDNAIKYSTGKIDVHLYTVGSKAIIKVENSCDELKIGKYNNWFERFVRGDESRSSNIKGFGIGLSVAKAICDQHGAKIAAHSKTGNELEIVMTL